MTLSEQEESIEDFLIFGSVSFKLKGPSKYGPVKLACTGDMGLQNEWSKSLNISGRKSLKPTSPGEKERGDPWETFLNTVRNTTRYQN